ncbi:hypothetical protein BGZ73_005889, partial [Actinomortierella ambigua]
MGFFDKPPAQPHQPSFAGVPLPGIEVTGPSPDPEHALTAPLPPIVRSPEGQPPQPPAPTDQHGTPAAQHHP